MYDLTAVLRLKDEMSSKLRLATSALLKTQQAANTYRDATGRLRDEQGRYVKGTGIMTASLGSMAGGLGTLAAAAGVTTLALSGVSKAMDFEAQMSSIKALTGASGQEMKQMTDLAMDMGVKTKYSALEAAKGIEELLKAGITPAQVQSGSLEAALNLATAGGLDLAKASEIMSTALNAYKADAMTAAQASNILAGTANASATSVEELQYGLSQVSAVAAGIGMSFKDTNIALGLFANNGLKGSDAGTSLKTMLSNLQPSTEAQTEAFFKLGLMAKDGSNAFFDATGSLKSLGEIAGLLQNSFKGMTDQQRAATMETLFGSDAIRAGNILYREGANGVKQFTTEMTKVSALDVAKEKMNNAAGAVEQFKGALETLQISVLTPLLPVIKDGALALSDWIANLKPEQIQAWGDKIKNGAQSALDFAGAIKDNWPAIRETVIAFGVALLAYKGIMAGLTIIKTITTLMKAYRAGTLIATVAQWNLNAAMLANPIGLVVLAIAALVAAGVLLYRNWDTVKEKMNNAWNSIKKGAASMVNSVIGELNSLIKMINKIPGVNIPIVPKVHWGNVKNDAITKSHIASGGRQMSMAGGMSYIPRDNVAANLHRGERVLTAAENKEYTQGKGGGLTIEGGIHLYGVGGDLEGAADKLLDIIADKIEESGGAGAAWR